MSLFIVAPGFGWYERRIDWLEYALEMNESPMQLGGLRFPIIVTSHVDTCMHMFWYSSYSAVIHRERQIYLGLWISQDIVVCSI